MKGLLFFLLPILLFYSSALPVFADVLLPENLEIVEEEAFRGDVSIKDIVIPENVSTICNYAFAETSLNSITVPASVTSIASDAFEGINTPMLIISSPNSEAVTFALNNNLDFNANSVKRALVIGQVDYPDEFRIEGPGKDIIKICDALNEYEITTGKNLTAKEMIDGISNTFEDAKEEDISLFYYSGHGRESDGALIGIDINSYVTASDLRSAMDKIPGRKIVLVDSCYSGKLIGRSSTKSNKTDPAVLFLNSFIEKRRSPGLNTSHYFVIVSSEGDEESWEASYGGLFTDAFVKSKTFADENLDSVVSFEEAYQYTKEMVYHTAMSGGETQSVQVYPENCFWFGLFR